ALERHWSLMVEIEARARYQFQRGFLGMADFALAKDRRLEAEIRLTRARAKLPKPPGTGLSAGESSGGASPLDKEVARAQLGGSRADLGKLRRERVKPLQLLLQERQEEFRSGRRTVDVLLDAARRVLDAELAVTDTPAVRAAALELTWQHARQADRLTAAK